MKRKVLIVHNPFAAKGVGNNGLQKLKNSLEAQSIDYEIIETEEGFSQNRKNLAEKTTQNFTEIWVSGGDGTLHQLINCLPKELWQLPVAAIPTGSGNDFVKNYLKKPTLDNAIQAAINGKPQPCDIWQCNDKLFIHGLGIGFDGQVVESMLKGKSFFKGFIGYYYHVLRLLLNYKEKEFVMLANGEKTTFPCFMVTIGNSTTFGGGFKITPKAKLGDEKLDVCAISEVPVLQRPRYLKSVEKGRHLQLRFVNYFTADRIIIKTPDIVPGHIDGELFYGQEFEIVKYPKTLLVIMP